MIFLTPLLDIQVFSLLWTQVLFPLLSVPPPSLFRCQSFISIFPCEAPFLFCSCLSVSLSPSPAISLFRFSLFPLQTRCLCHLMTSLFLSCFTLCSFAQDTFGRFFAVLPVSLLSHFLDKNDLLLITRFPMVAKLVRQEVEHHDWKNSRLFVSFCLFCQKKKGRWQTLRNCCSQITDWHLAACFSSLETSVFEWQAPSAMFKLHENWWWQLISFFIKIGRDFKPCIKYHLLKAQVLRNFFGEIEILEIHLQIPWEIGSTNQNITFPNSWEFWLRPFHPRIPRSNAPNMSSATKAVRRRDFLRPLVLVCNTTWTPLGSWGIRTQCFGHQSTVSSCLWGIHSNIILVSEWSTERDAKTDGELKEIACLQQNPPLIQTSFQIMRLSGGTENFREDMISRRNDWFLAFQDWTSDF